MRLEQTAPVKTTLNTVRNYNFNGNDGLSRDKENSKGMDLGGALISSARDHA